MHPDQFILLNSINEKVFQKSVKEIEYHVQILNLLHVDFSCKIQIHVGGVYGNKKESINRFIERYSILDKKIKKRLVIENDDRLYSFKDCIKISEKTSIPILFDNFHHEILNYNESLKEIFSYLVSSWKKQDGVPMVDYSSANIKKRKGVHSEKIDLKHFKKFINQTLNFDFDIMLEIKEKEKSALKVIDFLSNDNRLIK
jgi:UV DNA damage endonuclease